MSSLCIWRKASPTFTDAKYTHMDKISIFPCRNFSTDSCRRKLPLKFTQTKSSFLNTRMLEKNSFSCFAWPVKCTVLKLQDVVSRVSSAVTRYTGCNRRNGPDFGRVFLMLNYTEKPQNTYIQSWTVTEIMASKVWKFDSCYTLTYYQIRIETGRNMWFL